MVFRSLLASCALLLLSACVSNSLAWCASDGSLLSRFGSTRARAVEVLRTVPRLEGRSLGVAGVSSCATAAYGAILVRRDAAPIFRSLLKTASPAGRVYALAGLYEIDPVEFERAVGGVEAAAPLEFEQLNGCIGTSESRRDVFARLRAGDLSAWWRPENFRR